MENNKELSEDEVEELKESISVEKNKKKKTKKEKIVEEKAERKKEVKPPVSQEKIFKIMLIMTFSVAGVFFIKNVLSKSLQGAIVIGVCLFVFWLVQFLMKKLHVSQLKQQLVMCICLVFLTFIISISSGAYYSDDFPLFLAVLAISGLYLEPLYTKIQTVLITIILIALYFINPDKADPLSQYIMCIACFDVAAFVINLVIKRGRAFIEMSMVRAEEAEKLLNSIYKVSEELNESYNNSSSRIDGMRVVNDKLEENALELRKGSLDITQGTKDVELTCADVHERMKVTENHIGELNREVKNVEVSLEESKNNIAQMDSSMNMVKKTIDETNSVFTLLQEQIEEISKVAERLTNIDASTKMLALNASIEAARAGESGKGFAVVAGKVQDLAVDSNSCSTQVIKVVKNMKTQIEQTKEQLLESVSAIDESINAMSELTDGFDGLINQFDSLYENIERQNENVSDVDKIFERLKDKIAEMSASSEENQSVVESIVDAMESYKNHMNLVVEDAKQLQEISSTMIK
ncbi:MAG: hypothetical protein IJA34_17325 [Lachnospiraceae bacterium]|nr:hypothetical protein [Lachnospiraceae bacterium]